MILVTGDTHGIIGLEKIRFACKTHKLSNRDYVIIAGDFGCIWDEKSLNFNLIQLSLVPCNILFVDGNHENYDLLNSFPLKKWNGGYVHHITKNVIHLTRGQIFNIEGKKLLSLGGAESSDKHLRIRNLSWWEQESITQQNIQEAFSNLKNYDYTIDYVISHTCPVKYCTKNLCKDNVNKEVGQSEYFLDIIENNCKYKSWLFGHWHKDINIIQNKVVCLYQNFIKLE